ncbi:conjugal transfer protein TraF [Luteitalea sp.]
MTVARVFLSGCALLLLLPRPALAQGMEVVGIRALGMGGAFVAVADDATATYWNPAGLVTGSLFSAVAELGRGDREIARAETGGPGTWLASGTGSGTLVAVGTWPVGATFYRLTSASALVDTPSADGRPLRPGAFLDRLTTTQVGVNLLQTIVSGLHVGTTVKYVYGSAAFDAVQPVPGDPLGAAGDLPTRGSHRFDMDAGVIADFETVKLGLTVRNLFEPEFDTPVEGARMQLTRLARAGVAIRPANGLIVSLDADLTRTRDVTGEWRSLAAGAEQRFWQDRAAVRGGFRMSTTGETRPTVTTGGSLSLRSGIFADGYVAVGLGAASSDSVGVGLRIVF